MEEQRPTPEKDEKIIDQNVAEEATESIAEKENTTEETAEEPKESPKTETEESTIESAEEVTEEGEVEEEVINFEEMTKEELVVLLEESVKEDDVTRIKNKVASIKVAFLKLNKVDKDKQFADFIENGGKEEEYVNVDEPLEVRFKASFNIYKQNKAKYNADQEALKERNLELKKQVLEELKDLINSEETLKKTYDEFKAIQERWKEIGIVAQGEVNNLWQNYHFLVEKFFDKVKINKELRDLDLKRNLEQKIEICEKTEELLLEPSIIKSFKELQKLHDNWKEIGPVPYDKKDEIWDRFKAATDKINERRKNYYDNLHEEQKKNLESKTALCIKAEELCTVELSNIKDWQKYSDELNELMKVWRTIGPAPKKHNDEIWARFKGQLNAFFERKKDFYNKLKEQQMNNYNLKVDLCVQAEALKESTEWKKTTNDLIQLQKEWKTIGPVPKKHSDKVWKRFRTACDEFFEKKSEYFSNIHSHEADNLTKKKELIEKIKAYSFSENKEENLNVFKDFQREWMDIGHVPIKMKDKIQSEFRKAIDSQMQKLSIDETEMTAINYKTRFENVKNAGEAKNMMSRERSFLTNKINKLRDDINLWENNVGFFAESKNANLLKVEFEKKIDKAKQEMLVLEAKLKALNKSMID
ncbi:MAG: DNA primase [Bacteroidetes bacterium]|nr:DNA primase [Bacteroidota bacterium]